MLFQLIRQKAGGLRICIRHLPAALQIAYSCTVAGRPSFSTGVASDVQHLRCRGVLFLVGVSAAGQDGRLCLLFAGLLISLFEQSLTGQSSRHGCRERPRLAGVVITLVDPSICCSLSFLCPAFTSRVDQARYDSDMRGGLKLKGKKISITKEKTRVKPALW